MTPTRSGAVTVLTVTLGIAAAGHLSCRRSPGPTLPGEASGGSGALATLPFDLYFPAAAGKLRAERRELRVADEPAARAQVLVAALLDGPTREGLAAPLPDGVEIGAVFLSPPPERVLYLEFRSASLASPPASGSEQELQTVYSVVDTVLLNIPDIRRVVLLWNGSQRESFAGHVDTASALAARETLIDRS